jgi:hypothetical protein
MSSLHETKDLTCVKHTAFLDSLMTLGHCSSGWCWLLCWLSEDCWLNVKIVHSLNRCNISIQTYSVNFSHLLLFIWILCHIWTRQNYLVCSRLIPFLKCGVLFPIITFIGVLVLT